MGRKRNKKTVDKHKGEGELSSESDTDIEFRQPSLNLNIRDRSMRSRSRINRSGDESDISTHSLPHFIDKEEVVRVHELGYSSMPSSITNHHITLGQSEPVSLVYKSAPTETIESRSRYESMPKSVDLPGNQNTTASPDLSLLCSTLSSLTTAMNDNNTALTIGLRNTISCITDSLRETNTNINASLTTIQKENQITSDLLKSMSVSLDELVQNSRASFLPSNNNAGPSTSSESYIDSSHTLRTEPNVDRTSPSQAPHSHPSISEPALHRHSRSVDSEIQQTVGDCFIDRQKTPVQINEPASHFQNPTPVDPQYNITPVQITQPAVHYPVTTVFDSQYKNTPDTSSSQFHIPSNVSQDVHGRSSRRNQNIKDIRPQDRHIKLPAFTGNENESWKVWFTRFTAIGNWCNWDDTRRLNELIQRLDGVAAYYVFDEISPEYLNNFQCLVKELSNRFQSIETHKMYN